MDDTITDLDFSMSKVAHDLRTPLTAIQGYGELLLEDLELGLIEEAPGYLINILALVVELEIMIGNLLDLERLKKGEAVMELKDADLNILVREMTPRMERLITANGMSLQLNLSEPPVLCRVDRYCTKQSIQNLVCCALLEPNKGGQIEIGTRPEGEHAVVVVTRAGSELRRNQRWQPSSTTEGSEHGAGSTEVALYIARSFIEAQNGELVAKRLPSGTSSFTMKLPN